MTTTQTAAPKTRDELANWLRDRGVPDHDMDNQLARYAGKTEAEMDEIYDRMCGPTA